MANTVLNAQIKMRSDTSANWELHNDIVPAKGEIIVYTDLNKIKVGDGVKDLSTLSFVWGMNMRYDASSETLIIE